LVRIFIGITAIVAVVACAAVSAAGAEDPRRVPALAAGPASWPRLLGVVADPWHSDEWEASIGGRVDVQMLFRAFSRRTDLAPIFAEAERRGIMPMLTWEPWEPAHGVEPGRVQPEYANAAIAAGAQDDYLRSVARAVAGHHGPVVIRYAHEMNGDWYPWHNDARAYVAAWRHVVSLFRSEGATNAVWIWSVAAAPRLGRSSWWAGLQDYWPGAPWVDAVGMTAVRSAQRLFSVERYGRRLAQLRAFGKPIWFTEVVAHVAHGRFAAEIGRFVAANSWVRAVVWSQPTSIAPVGSEVARALGRVAGVFAAERGRRQAGIHRARLR
jgi:hypothetical protein